MRWLLLAALLACTACKHKAPSAPTQKASEVHVDRRVETVSIVMRLAGADEYKLASPSTYVDDVDKQLSAFADHKAVAMARELHGQGIGFDAPIELAVHLDDPDVEKTLPAAEPRWNGKPIKDFIAQIHAFQADAKLDAFFAAHAAYVKAVEDRVRSAVDKENPSGWFADFFGAPASKFVVVPGLLQGPTNYGVHTKDTMYQVIGLGTTDAQGLPDINEQVIETLVHEMAHSFINPLFEAHAAELLPAAQQIYPFVAKAMESQHYGTAQTMLNEAGVRAITVLYVRDRKGADAAAEATRAEVRSSFVWTRELADHFAKHKTDIPELAKFLNDLAKQYKDKGLPQLPFLGPVNDVVTHDVVVVAPKEDTVLTKYVVAVHDKFFANAPLVTADDHVLAAHTGVGVVAYGSPKSNPVIAEVAKRASWTIEDNALAIGPRRWGGEGLVLIACWPRADDPKHGIAVYTGARDADLADINSVEHGSRDWLVARRDEHGKFAILDSGDFHVASDGSWKP
jgi:hypothetical protein